MTLRERGRKHHTPSAPEVIAERYAALYKERELSPRFSEPSPSHQQHMDFLHEEDLQPVSKLKLFNDGSMSPRIPIVHSNKENVEDDGLMSPRRLMDQASAFSSMCSAGAGWGSALVHALQGHKMTEEQAAICLQSHWRRHETVVNRIAEGLAAEHIQRVQRERMWLREGAAAAVQASMRSHRERKALQARAATKINMVWRGHLARVHANQLRKDRNKGLRRALSFSSKRRKGPSGHSQPASPATPADHRSDFAVKKEDPNSGSVGLAKRVRRSLSFDRKRASESQASSSGGTGKVGYVSATKRTFVVERGPDGLGLELDATNTIVTIKPNSRAARQALLLVGDTVLTVDGKSCAGKLMVEIMIPGRPVYVMEVSRPNRGAEMPPPKRPSMVKRSFSFDRKHAGGGVRRSFSFDRKR